MPDLIKWWTAHDTLKRHTGRDVTAAAVSRFVSIGEDALERLAAATAKAIHEDEQLRRRDGIANRPRVSPAHVPSFRFSKPSPGPDIEVSIKRAARKTIRGLKSSSR